MANNVTPEVLSRRAAAAEMHLYGVTNRQIAKALGVSSSVISKYLDDAGVRKAKGQLTRLRVRNALRRHGLEVEDD